MAQRNSEVAVVNIFTWCGIVGVAIFMLFYWKEGILGIKAQNAVLKSLGIYIAFFWIISWIGNIFYFPSFNYILLYMVIGMINDNVLREMNDEKMELYLKDLLSK